MHTNRLKSGHVCVGRVGKLSIEYEVKCSTPLAEKQKRSTMKTSNTHTHKRPQKDHQTKQSTKESLNELRI